MSSKASRRMATGFVQARRGTKVGSQSRDTSASQPGSRTPRTALLKWMDRQPEAMRPVILAELNGRGDPQAKALAAELTERWGMGAP